MRMASITRRHFLLGSTGTAFALAFGKARALRRGGIAIPSGGSGFAPDSGITVSGTFADGQTVTINKSAGGFGTKPNGTLPRYYFPLETDFYTHSTLSRNPHTIYSPDPLSSIQTSIKPPNAVGAAKTVAADSGVELPPPIIWQDPLTMSGTGDNAVYIFCKRYFDHIWDWQNPNLTPPANYFVNVKLNRIWADASGGSSGDFFWGGDASTQFEPVDTSYYFPQPDAVNSGIGVNTWLTHEAFYSEPDVGLATGVRNFAQNGLMCQDTSSLYVNRNSTYSHYKTLLYFSEYSNLGSTNIPGTPDPVGNDYHHCIYVDDSFYRVMVSNEAVYSTTSASREICIPTAWADTSVSCVIRQGEFASLSGLYLWLYTGPYSPTRLGRFT